MFYSPMKKAIRLVVLLLVLGAIGYYVYLQTLPQPLVLTGIVTTHDVVVSPQIGGRIGDLMVNEGDQVTKGQLLAVLSPDELRQETAFYAASAEGVGEQVREGEAALRLQEMQSADQIRQAEATLQATESQRSAAEAELENARLALDRADRTAKQGISTLEQLDTARTAYEVAKSRVAGRREPG